MSNINEYRTITGKGNTILEKDRIIYCDSSQEAVEMTLPKIKDLENPKLFNIFVVDLTKSAFKNNVTVKVPKGVSINGETSVVFKGQNPILEIKVEEENYIADL